MSTSTVGVFDTEPDPADDVPGITDDDQMNKIALFCQYCAEGDLEHAKECVSNLPDIIQFKDVSGFTGLHWACLHDRKEIVTWLLSLGSDILAQGPNEETPFHWAAQGGALTCLNIIIEELRSQLGN